MIRITPTARIIPPKNEAVSNLRPQLGGAAVVTLEDDAEGLASPRRDRKGPIKNKTIKIARMRHLL